jgi:hypothetical protein
MNLTSLAKLPGRLIETALSDYRSGRIAREKITVARMLEIYCAQHHPDAGNDLCPACFALLQFARCRLDGCPFGADKPLCSHCRIHCYQGRADLRAEIKAAMRYSGPRMLLRHPILSILHQLDRGLRLPGGKSPEEGPVDVTDRRN